MALHNSFRVRTDFLSAQMNVSQYSRSRSFFHMKIELSKAIFIGMIPDVFFSKNEEVVGNTPYYAD